MEKDYHYFRTLVDRAMGEDPVEGKTACCDLIATTLFNIQRMADNSEEMKANATLATEAMREFNRLANEIGE